MRKTKNKDTKKVDYLDKVFKAMKGCDWEEGREIGVKILARWLGFKTYVGEEVDLVDLRNLLKDICESADKWVREEGGSFVIALAKCHRESEEEKENQLKNDE